MYVALKVDGREVLALLDSGATHNFIARSKVADLGLKVMKSSCQVKTLNSVAQPVGGVIDVVLKVRNWQGLCEFKVVIMNDFDMILSIDFFVKV